MTDSANNTENTNALDNTSKLEDLIKFPAKIKFKFIGENIEAFEPCVKSFFNDDMKLSVIIEPGKLSKSGKYITLNVTADVDNKDVMTKIYNDGSKIPHVMHVL